MAGCPESACLGRRETRVEMFVIKHVLFMGEAIGVLL
jgi:hypothetical protein